MYFCTSCVVEFSEHPTSFFVVFRIGEGCLRANRDYVSGGSQEDTLAIVLRMYPLQSSLVAVVTSTVLER